MAMLVSFRCTILLIVNYFRSDQSALTSNIYAEAARVPPIPGPMIGEAAQRLDGTDTNFPTGRSGHHTVRQPRPFLIDLSNVSC